MTFKANKEKKNVLIFIINTLINFVCTFLSANAELKMLSFSFLDFIMDKNWITYVFYSLFIIGNIILIVKVMKMEKSTNIIHVKTNEMSDVEVSIITPATISSKHSFENTNGYYSLDEIYTSIYAEDNELHSEIIHLKHNRINDSVTGDVTSLDGSMRFTLTGEFKDLILTGQYKATDGNKPERGSINLRLVEDFLTGFCSFSNAAKDKDPIRVNPYVWVPGDKKNLLNGTYEFCTECHKDGAVCCCSSERIDEPLLLPNETQSLVNWVKKEEGNIKETITPDYFSESIKVSKATLQIRRMKRAINNDKSCASNCYFYDANHNKCKIYEKRPIDCKLFPFDVIINPKNGELHIGYYQHLCGRALPDQSEMIKYAQILRPYFFIFYPYAHTTSLKPVAPRLHKEIISEEGFVDLGTLRDFLF
jgi:Fe-S-cluster containining protein